MDPPWSLIVADDPATPPQAVIHPGQRCTTIGGEELAEQWSRGVRTWGNSPDGSTVILTGTYHLHSEVSQRLLRALPTTLVLREDEWDCPLIPLLADEIVKDEPGQEAVLDRLLDLLLIAVLRSWFARPDAAAPTWYRAYADPVVGHARHEALVVGADLNVDAGGPGVLGDVAQRLLHDAIDDGLEIRRQPAVR